MANDVTLKAVFDYAKQPQLSSGELPQFAAVYATFVEHLPNLHPPKDEGEADLVTYANGRLTLSQDKKTLTGELRLWRNSFDPGSPGFVGAPGSPPDAFDDAASELTVMITVSDAGKVTHQRRIKGKPIGAMPPVPMNATYDAGLFVEKTTTSLRSLSFTLGTT